MQGGRGGKQVLIAALALAVSAMTASRGARAASVAGIWKWALHGACADSARNTRACEELNTMGLHIYDVKATRLTYRGVDHLTVSAAGQFTEKGWATFSANSPGAAMLRVCNPNVIERRLYRRTCHVTWTGRGHIAEGGTFLPDFYSDAGRLTFHNPAVTYYQNYSGIGDSLLPAVPGTYNTHHYLSLVGYARFIPGISIDLTVTHIAP